MTKKSEKKFKKLRKGHIWPSIVFLFLSMILIVVTASFAMSFIIQHFSQERLRTSYQNCVNIVQMFSEGKNMDDAKKTMNYLEKKSKLSDAVYLLDEKGELCLGYGEQTYNTDLSSPLSGDANYNIYADKNESYSDLLEDFTSDNFYELLSGINEESLKSAIEYDFATLDVSSADDVVFEGKYWLGTTLPDNKTILIRSKLVLYNKDFALAVVVGGTSFIAMTLPILFLFLNVVNNVRNQRHMTKLIYTDSTTLGNNRLYFEHYAQKTLCRQRHAKDLYAVVNISLMKYRIYCNFHGTKAGEALLVAIQNQLETFLERHEFCAHMEKSDFALLLKGSDTAQLEERVNTIVDTVSRRIHGHNLIFHAGIFFLEPKTKKNGQRYIRRKHIDIAGIYNSACTARACCLDETQTQVASFDQKLLDEQLWEHTVEEKMHTALKNEEFQVYIQPKYDPTTEQLKGAEALVRWINNEDGFISPGRFIPIFEKNGFITQLDDYMISHVAKLQAQWIKEGKQVVPVSVNVSRAHFANPDLAKHICQLVDVYKVPHKLIEIELTESAFFDDKVALLRTIQELKEFGFDVSMDDFGSGYSSLNSLKDLPLNVLKLDAEFFRGEDKGERGEIVISQAIHLAKQLDMRVVAEGVEKKNQVDFLATQGCDMIQGFYFAKPMPAEEYADRLEKEN